MPLLNLTSSYIRLRENDILIIKVKTEYWSKEIIEGIKNELLKKPRPHNAPVLIINEGIDISTISEEEMAALGWKRVDAP